jgi:DNA repair exonuclease SbcCD ATPase subunit
MTNWKKIEARLESRYAELRMTKQQHQEALELSKGLRQRIVDAGEARVVFTACVSLLQAKAHENIAKLVTTCLRSVFPDPYEFRITTSETSRGYVSRFQFLRDGEEFDPFWEMGGGVVDVASFALRCAAVLYAKPKIERLVVLDEPFRCVSKEVQQKLKELILALAADMGFQFLIVTHESEFRLGEVVDLQKDS